VPKRKDSFGNEAFSTKILEFMSSGVPVVVSNTKIDQYYFNDSVVKFFKDGDHDDLAQTMSLLIANRGIRDRMIQNAAEFVSTFDWEANKGTYIEIVDRLLEGSGNGHEGLSAARQKKPPMLKESSCEECVDVRAKLGGMAQPTSTHKATAGS
jgi:hypothetical protein